MSVIPRRPEHVRLARACFVPASDAHDLGARCAAVLDSSAADTVVASVTAARLHGLWLPELPETIHVATSTPGRAGRSMTRTKRVQFVAHRFQLAPEEIVQVAGLPVTSIARTWRDLATEVGLAALVAAGDSALRSGVARDELSAQLVAAPRIRHCRTARMALSLLDERSRSRPESHLRVAVSARDLPRFEVNEPVHRDEGGWLAEPDLSLAEAKIALEYQGIDHADPSRMRKDLTRASDLRDHGWIVLAYGPAEVFGRPEMIAREVRREIALRAPRLMRRRSA